MVHLAAMIAGILREVRLTFSICVSEACTKDGTSQDYTTWGVCEFVIPSSAVYRSLDVAMNYHGNILPPCSKPRRHSYIFTALAVSHTIVEPHPSWLIQLSAHVSFSYTRHALAHVQRLLRFQGRV
jgi:hypothetical protein